MVISDVVNIFRIIGVITISNIRKIYTDLITYHRNQRDY